MYNKMIHPVCPVDDSSFVHYYFKISNLKKIYCTCVQHVVKKPVIKFCDLIYQILRIKRIK